MDIKKLYKPIEGPLNTIDSSLAAFEKSLIKLVDADYKEIKFMLSIGKKLRAVLLLLAAGLDNTTDDVCQVATAVELVHYASLIHDDILDDEIERRGAKPIYQQLSLKTSLLLGDYILADSMKLLPDLHYKKTTQIILEQVKNMCLGEFTQLKLKDNTYQLSEYKAKYLEVISQKTASLFAASCKLGSLFNPNAQNITHLYNDLGINIGMAFQLLDDSHEILEYTNTGNSTKSLDISIGILTLPYLLYAEHPAINQNIEWLKQATNSDEKLIKVHHRMSQLDIFKDLYLEISRYLETASQIIKQVPDKQSQKHFNQIIDHLQKNAQEKLCC